MRLDNLGDVIMTTPALRAVRSNGTRSITLLASASGAEAARYVPEVDRVLRYAAPWVKHDEPAEPGADRALHEALARERFDAAIIFTVYSQNPLPAAHLCYLAGIPLRLAHCRENPYRLLTDWIPESEPERGVRHEVQRQLDLVAAVGATSKDSRLAFTVPVEATKRIDGLLARTNPSGGTLVVAHPGATAASRRYPPAQFAEALRLLCDSRACHVVVTGSGSEQDLVRTVCKLAGHAERIHDVAGELGLPELAALIARSSMLISNNTGPVHIASALGTRVVVLYALTNPQHTPWCVPHRVLFHDVPCRYCYKSVCPQGHNACLREVAPREVAAAACELLDVPASTVQTSTQMPALAYA